MDMLALVIAVLIALLIGAYFRQYLIDSMSNVHVAQEAQEYLQRETVNITLNSDNYLYTNISVIPKPNNDDEQKNIDDDNFDDDNFDDDNFDDDNDFDDSDNDSDSGGDSDGGDGGD